MLGPSRCWRVVGGLSMAIVSLRHLPASATAPGDGWRQKRRILDQDSARHAQAKNDRESRERQ